MTRYADPCPGATPMNDVTTMRSTSPAESGLADTGLGFDRPVPADGYRWWYVDGFSDCGRYGITVIAFIGSVFSPYYFRARRRGPAAAANHVSLNVILYGPNKARWCMTERGSDALHCAARRLDIGPSALTLSDRSLQIDICERAMPSGLRVTGRVTVAFDRILDDCFELDGVGRHWWWPIAPAARIGVELHRPDIQWSGSAYMDSNFGAEPIEKGFQSWNWCRGHSSSAGCDIHYDAQLRSGEQKQLSLRLDPEGRLSRQAIPDLQQLPRGAVWRVARPARLPPAVDRRLVTLEDTPFYTRSRIQQGDAHFMHESLDLDRFGRSWVQCLLPFRMPRVASQPSR